jgi:hypothetical protein
MPRQIIRGTQKIEIFNATRVTKIWADSTVFAVLKYGQIQRDRPARQRSTGSAVVRGTGNVRDPPKQRSFANCCSGIALIVPHIICLCYFYFTDLHTN